MPTVSPPQITKIPIGKLEFDFENPRLAEYGVTESTSEDDLLVILWDAMDVRELVQSIAASGYFAHEPMIAIKDGTKFVIIEGNRRLAAVKVLQSPTLAAAHHWDVPSISDEAKTQLGELPVIVSTRKDAWRYLGFKHVNGPAKWSSYAKAKYIADVHRQFKVPLDVIANQIGDRHRTVQRLYRGLMVIEQAERTKVYDREDRFRRRFAFSHLYTGLDYEGFSEFLNLREDDAESTSPVPAGRMKQLGELCVWLFGSRRQKKAPVVETQNPHLRQLDAILRSREAIAALRDGSDIGAAYELTRAASVVLEESLLKSKRELTRARAYLTTGYDGSEELLRVAGTVAELADDVYSEMERKRQPVPKKRLTEGR
jgi:ParB-like nuclease domain